MVDYKLESGMLIKVTNDNGEVGYKWGEKGKPYFGEDAKYHAFRQGCAIHYNYKRMDADAVEMLPMTADLGVF